VGNERVSTFRSSEFRRDSILLFSHVCTAIFYWGYFLGSLEQIQKPAFSHNRVPMRKRRFSIRVFLRELVQALPRYDVHYGRATLTETFSGEKGVLQRRKEELGRGLKEGISDR
jgi:hypothetical protein